MYDRIRDLIIEEVIECLDNEELSLDYEIEQKIKDAVNIYINDRVSEIANDIIEMELQEIIEKEAEYH